MTDTKAHTDGLSVVQAVAAVADDVREVRKAEKNSHAGYNFRGIDAVMNAVGPALRAHGVVVMPETMQLEQSVVQTTGGKPQTSSRVQVRYRFYGPAGDHMDAVVWGEAWDGSDKGLAQAYSVAYRTCLLQALTIPTDDPDPDSRPVAQRAVEPVAGPEMVGTIKAAVALLEPEQREAFKAWWKSQQLPALSSGQLTDAQAHAVLDHLDSVPMPSVEPSEAPEGPSSGEVQPSVADPVGDGHEGEAGGLGHPAGPPTAAARAALRKVKP